MSSLIQMNPTVNGEQTFDFEYEGTSYEALVTPRNVVVADIGEFGGAVTTIYASGEKHMCGLQGYDPMLGDSCPSCDSSTHKRSLLDFLKKAMLEQGLLEREEI